jgi:DNA (cytosine-5)-methyltransferase 1
MNKIKLISLFSGAGGFDLGFEKSKMFETDVAVEFNQSYAKTLFLNKNKLFFGNIFLGDTKILVKDVSKLDGAEILNLSSIKSNEIFGIIGGPPCQSFSIMGERLGLSDERGNLTFDFIRLITELKPNFFVFENVPNLKSISNGIIYNEIIYRFKKAGYFLDSDILDASKYGAWTFRKRLVIIGSRDFKITLPEYSHSEISAINLFGETIYPMKKVGDLLNSLPTPDSEQGKLLSHHKKVNHSEEVILRFNQLGPGQKDEIRRRYRLDPKKPANTVVSGGEGGYLMNIHPFEPRELTLRESAMIQGFPIEYQFYGIPREVAKQIANSVPIELANALADKIGKRYLSI